MSTLCIYYDSWQEKNLKNIYNKGVHFKSNPRSFEYMESLAMNNYKDSDIKIVKNIEDLKKISFEDYQEIILLYPDSIGLGWSKIEKTISNLFNPIKSIKILNGRNRNMILNKNVLFSLRFKRFLEHTLLFELLFTLFFIISTPFLIIKDFINGKK